MQRHNYISSRKFHCKSTVWSRQYDKKICIKCCWRPQTGARRQRVTKSNFDKICDFRILSETTLTSDVILVPEVNEISNDKVIKEEILKILLHANLKILNNAGSWTGNGPNPLLSDTLLTVFTQRVYDIISLNFKFDVLCTGSQKLRRIREPKNFLSV